MRANINLHNMDCMEAMKKMGDNQFDLAIVDPPYGIGENWKKDRHSKFYKHESSYKNNTIPEAPIFNHLFRVSKNQIIWGGNYYTEYLAPSNAWIIWNKLRNANKTFNSEAELAWSSFNKVMRVAAFRWNGAVTCAPRYGKHPHEKPVALYKWLLQNYAKEGDKILDTYGGSMSIAIACWDLGYDLEIYEIDKEYYENGVDRFNNHCKQGQLF